MSQTRRYLLTYYTGNRCFPYKNNGMQMVTTLFIYPINISQNIVSRLIHQSSPSSADSLEFC